MGRRGEADDVFAVSYDPDRLKGNPMYARESCCCKLGDICAGTGVCGLSCWAARAGVCGGICGWRGCLCAAGLCGVAGALGRGPSSYRSIKLRVE